MATTPTINSTSCYRAMMPPPMELSTSTVSPSASSSPHANTTPMSMSTSTETLTLTLPPKLVPTSSMSELQLESGTRINRSTRQQSPSVAIAIRNANPSHGHEYESFTSHLRKTIMAMYCNPKFRTAYSVTSLLCESVCAALAFYAMIKSAKDDANFLVFVSSVIFVIHYTLSILFIGLRMKYKQMWQNDPFYMTPKIAILRYCFVFCHTIFVLAYGAILYLYSEFHNTATFSEIHSLRITISFLIVYEGIFVSLLLVGLILMTYIFGGNRVLNALCPPAWATNEPVVTKVTCPGLTTEQINAIPSVTFQNGMFDGQMHGCAICLLDIVHGDVLRQLSCQHSFHTECVDAWLEIRASCPLCVRKVNTASTKKKINRSHSVAPRSSRNISASITKPVIKSNNINSTSSPPSIFVAHPSITQQQVELSTSVVPAYTHYETHSHL